MNIGLDFDGVIANTHPLKAIVAKERFGVNIPPENFARKNIVGKGILTLEQYIQVGQEVMGGIYLMPEVADALFYINLLAGEKHSLKVITSRTESMLDVANKWLYDHGLACIPIVGVGYNIQKTKACKGLDLYIDDDLEKLLPLVGSVPHLLFFSWPWNISEKEPSGIIRVTSWWDIYNYVHYEI